VIRHGIKEILPQKRDAGHVGSGHIHV